MKKYTSVFGLFTKSSFIKILLIMAAMAGAQFYFFSAELNKHIDIYEYDFNIPSIETLIDRTRIDWIFGIAFVLVTLLLCLPGTSFSSKTGYTLNRLSISERSVFFCQAAYNLFIYLILWVAEAAVCFGLCLYYTASVPAEILGNQTVFLAFYRNEFLHALLPLSEVMVWVRNGFLLVAITIASAEYPYKQRRKKIGASAIAMTLFTLIFFSVSIADSFNTILVIVVSIINMIEMLYNFFSEDNGYESEN